MSQVPRTLVSQCVIGSACLIGLALGVLEPLHAEQRDAVSQLEEAQSLAARAGELSARMPALTAERAAFARDAALICERSAPARDTARLNAGIEDIAAKAGVEVERTQPREPAALAGASTRAAPAATDPGATPDIQPDAVAGFALDVVGSYAGLASFVRALESDLGFTRVVSLRVTPEGEYQDRVRASITTAHFAFSLPKPAAPGEPTDAPDGIPTITEAKP